MDISSVSTSYLATAMLPAIQQSQAQLATLEIESSSGQYADLGLQLGAQSGNELSLRNEDDLLQALTSANGVASTNLTAAQTALGSISSTAQSAASQLTSLLSGDSASATQVQLLGSSNLQQLTALANTSQGGQYVFGGINSAAAPLDDYFSTPASTAKSALDQAFESAFGFPVTSAQTSGITATQMQSFLDGPVAQQFSSTGWGNWSAASSTNTSAEIAPGQTAETSTNANTPGVQQLAQGYAILSEFGDIGLGSAAQATLASSALTLINTGVASITTTQAQLGTAQTQITDANASMASQMTIIQTQLGNLDSVDAASVATQLSTLQTQLETAYQLTAQIQKLSLAQYLPT